MPLFGKKHLQKEVVPEKAGKVTKAPKAPAVKAEKKAVAKKTEGKAVVAPKSSIILKPRVTEKAGILSEKGIYTFDVARTANAQQIAAAIKVAYKVTPVKVSVVKVPSKSMLVRGKKGSTSAGKKAYVFLKKGDTIQLA